MNLDAKLSLFRLDHRLVNGKVVYSLIQVATSDPASGLNASLAMNLTPGNYYAVVGSHSEFGDVGQYTLKGSFSKPLTVDPNVVAGPLLSAMAFNATAPPAIVQPAPVSSSVKNSNQLLAMAATIPSTPVFQSTSNQAATSKSLHAAAVDEAMATGVTGKKHKLPDDLFDLLAAA